MAKVKSSVASRKRRKKILKQAKGYSGSKRTLFRTANEQVMRSLRYSYIGRKQRKRDFRKLWIQRINAACRLNGTKYSQFIYGLSLADVNVNRKMLANMAVHDPEGFSDLVLVSQEAIKTYPNGKKDKLNGNAQAVLTESKPAPAKKVEEKVVEEKVEAKVEEKTDEEVDLNSLTVVQLRDLAREKEITGFSTMKKAELVEALSK